MYDVYFVIINDQVAHLKLSLKQLAWYRSIFSLTTLCSLILYELQHNTLHNNILLCMYAFSDFWSVLPWLRASLMESKYLKVS